MEHLPSSIYTKPSETLPASITPSATSPSSVQITQTPTGSPEASKIISIWLPPDLDPKKETPSGKLISRRLKDFENQNPGVKVNVRIKNLASPQSMLETLSITSMAAPLALPSIVSLPHSDLESAVRQQLIFPLESSKNHIDQSDWYPFSQAMAKIDNKWYGAPYYGDALILAYRNSSTNISFSSWDSIKETNQPVLFPASEAGSLTTLALYQSLSGEIALDNNPKNLNEEYLIQVFSFYQNNARQGLFPYSISQYDRFDQTWTAFTNNQTRWVVTWSSSFLSASNDNFQAIPFPGLKDEPYSLATGRMFVLSEPNPERQILCMKLIDYLIEPEFLSALNQSNGSIPTRISANIYPNDLHKQMFFDQVSHSAHIQPSLTNYITLAGRLKDATTQVIRYQMTPKEAAELVISGSKSTPK